MTRRCKFTGFTGLAATSAAIIILLAAAADAHARSGKGHTPHGHGKLEGLKAPTTGTVKSTPSPKSPVVRDHRGEPPLRPPPKRGCEQHGKCQTIIRDHRTPSQKGKGQCPNPPCTRPGS